MSKKVPFIIICFFVFTSLHGCLEHTDPSSKTETIQVPLNQLALTINDLNESYDIINEEHITDPYIAEEGLLFEGWSVREKYQITFVYNSSTFIQHLIAQFDSPDKTKEFIKKVRHDIDTLGYTFEEIPCDNIGEETYLGLAEITVDGKKVISYFLAFRMAGVIVVLQTAGIHPDMVHYYGKIVEELIEANSIIV